MQAPILQRLDDLNRQRIVAPGDAGNGVIGIAERIRGEFCQRLLVALGGGAERTGDQQADGEYERNDAAVQGSHSVGPGIEQAAADAAACRISDQGEARQASHFLVTVL